MTDGGSAGLQGGRAVFLDPERSRAKITVTVQPNEAGDGLEVVGTPTYDVHLVPHAIQRPYPLPTVGHLIFPKEQPPRELYSDLESFAKRQGLTSAIPALTALPLVVGFVLSQDPAASEELETLHRVHLREGAGTPLIADADSGRGARGSAPELAHPARSGSTRRRFSPKRWRTPRRRSRDT